MCISSVCRHRRVCTLACCFAVFALSHQCSHRLPGACVVCLLLLCAVIGGWPAAPGPCQLRAKVERNRTKDTASAAEGRRLLAAAAAVGHRRLAGRSPSVYGLSPCQLRSVVTRGGAQSNQVRTASAVRQSRRLHAHHRVLCCRCRSLALVS